jgi:hypothetical protein
MTRKGRTAKKWAKHIKNILANVKRERAGEEGIQWSKVRQEDSLNL